MGLSQRQLCEYFGWDYKTIAQEAKTKGLSIHEYVQHKTGWISRKEVYYPPFNYSSQIEPSQSFSN